MKDGLESKTWYCARILRKYADRIHVHWFITDTPPTESYKTATKAAREARLRAARFLPTWVLKNSSGEPVTKPPTGSAYERDMWTGKIPLKEWDRLALVRNVGLDSEGRMNKSTLALARTLSLPHHLGAGGADDFASKEIYMKHKRRADSKKGK